jgi:hypothetical protein
MQFYEIEGTTLLSWRMTVSAVNEGEALDGVRERIAALVTGQASPVSFGAMGHRVIRCVPAGEGESSPAATSLS